MRSWFALAGLAMSTFVYVTVETLPIGLLPQIAASLGSTQAAVGLLVTAYGLVVVLATIPLTRATHRFSRRRLLAGLLGVLAVATAVSAVAPSYPVLLGARVLAALSQALFWAVILPAAAALFRPELRAKAVGIVYAGSSAGPLLGVPAGTWLGQQAGWRAPFLALSVLSLVILVVVVALMPEVAVGESPTDRGTTPDAGRYRVLVVATAVLVTGAFTALTYVTPFLTEVSGFSEAAVGPILLLRGLAGLTGAILGGFFATRRPWLSLIVVTAAEALALGAQYAFGASEIATVISISVASMALSGMTTVLGTRVLEVAPGSTDMASAGTSTAFNVGITGGALIGSGLLAGPGVRLVALVGALLALVALIVVLAEPKLATNRNPQPEPDMAAAH